MQSARLINWLRYRFLKMNGNGFTDIFFERMVQLFGPVGERKDGNKKEEYEK